MGEDAGVNVSEGVCGNGRGKREIVRVAGGRREWSARTTGSGRRLVLWVAGNVGS